MYAIIPECALSAPREEFRYILFAMNLPAADIPLLILGTDDKDACVRGIEAYKHVWPTTRKPIPFTRSFIQDKSFASKLKKVGILTGLCGDNFHLATTKVLKAIGPEWIMKEGKYYFRHDKPQFFTETS